MGKIENSKNWDQTNSVFTISGKEINQRNVQQFDKYHFKVKRIFMNTSNSKTNESNNFHYYFTEKLNLKNPNKKLSWSI